MKPILFLCFFILLISCSGSEKEKREETKETEKPNINHMLWLIGQWKSVKDDLVSYECWEKKNENLFSGISYTLKGADTLFKESITLQQNGNELYYIPNVSGQNENKPVPFKFTGIKNGEFYFENSEHDFPQQIIYKNPQPDFLCARIAGMTEGKFHQEDFNFVRVN